MMIPEGDNLLCDFFSWWQELRAWGETTPHIDKFEPMLARDMEPNMLLLERIASGAFHVRFWGTNLAKVSVVRRGSQDYLERFSFADAEIMGQHVSYATGRPCGGVMQRDVRLPDGRTVRANSLMLPLKSDDGVVRHLGGVGQILSVSKAKRKRALATAEVRFAGYIDLGNGIPGGAQEVKHEDLAAPVPSDLPKTADSYS